MQGCRNRLNTVSILMEELDSFPTGSHRATLLISQKDCLLAKVVSHTGNYLSACCKIRVDQDEVTAKRNH